jgi:hypothetical protein
MTAPAIERPSSTGAPPLYATAPTPGRRSHGRRIALLAAAMGRPLMPWQRTVADVGTEVLPDGSWAYPIVVVTVQRQSGKTTLETPVACERCLTTADAQTWYTAQTRQDARDNFGEAVKLLKRSPLRPPRTKIRLSNGSEGVTFPTGSFWRVFAPVHDALHGKANERVTVDEAWAFDGVRGLALEQAILPTFTTTGGQLWIYSTAGTVESAWLLSYVERGRAAVASGRREGIAYFEWGVDPEIRDQVEAGLIDGDPKHGGDRTAPTYLAALDAILAAHPANGYTLNLRALQTAAETMGAGEFLRAYGNAWTGVAERVIPASAVADTVTKVWPKPVALAFDVALDGSSASIASAWRATPDGPLRFDVVDDRPGTSWVPEALLKLQATWSPAAIAHPGAGPGVDVADAAARLGVRFTPDTGLSTRDYAAACSSILRQLVERRVAHLGQPAFVASTSAAQKRDLGDGGWAWSRRESAASIAPLVAATVAAWTFDHAPKAKPKPVVRSRSRRDRTPATATRRATRGPRNL